MTQLLELHNQIFFYLSIIQPNSISFDIGSLTLIGNENHESVERYSILILCNILEYIINSYCILGNNDFDQVIIMDAY